MNKNTAKWDYTHHAKHYDNRPNYAPDAIVHMLEQISPTPETLIVADIGSGTANLTMLMHDKVQEIFCVEPNEAMRNVGKEKTKNMTNVTWSVGTGEETTLEDNSVNLAAFGSSFNCTDRALTLKEAHRILKKDGYFCCMWNNRNLQEPTQVKVEEIIKEFYPEYSHGTRRQQQADVIIESKLFNHLYYFERPQTVAVELETYIDAWKSVKNTFWDLDTEEGKEIFEKIMNRIREEFKDTPTLNLVYVTKVWVAKKV